MGEDKPVATLPAEVALPTSYADRLALLEECWVRLSANQKAFLTALRECRFNARKAERLCKIDRRINMHPNADYATVLAIWRAQAGATALDKDRLLARQDDIVETLLTPKRVWYQGRPTGERVVAAASAGKANESLMRAAGLLKDKDVDINVGLVGPSLIIQVVQPDNTVIDVTPRGVEIALPEPVDES